MKLPAFRHFMAAFFIIFIIFFVSACSNAPETRAPEAVSEEYPPIPLPNEDEDLPVSAFGEIWVYVVVGREAALVRGLPLSDIGYFGAEVDSYGKLTGVPSRRTLPAFSGMVHLVVSCNGRALSYFALRPGSAERRELIADLLAATREYDGLQINFDNIPPRAGEAYFTFLQELRSGLGNKMLSVALAARTRKLADDVYDYEKILPYVDRILVMAYDEHWSGCRPGSVASLDWCRRVADYSLRVIGQEKLIMGLPFYGRAWGDYSPSRALVYTTTERIINENNVTEIQRENGIPVFDYNKDVSIKVYFEDAYSLAVRMDMYKTIGVDSVGFWRLGQETSQVWNYLKLGSGE